MYLLSLGVRGLIECHEILWELLGDPAWKTAKFTQPRGELCCTLDSCNSSFQLSFLVIMWCKATVNQGWVHASSKCSIQMCENFYHSWAHKVYSPNLLKSDCMSDVARICSIITFHLSKLWKVKFSILCDVIFLVRLQGNFDIDHSQEWKG